MRGIPIRAILVPVGVAMVAIAALSWYGLAWIPAQQRYLHERNSRLLRTIASQIRSKVDNLDQSVDHALESFEIANDQNPALLRTFDHYVKLFAPALEILDGTAGQALVEFDDPPRVVVRVDEGRHYLYLGFRHYVERDSGTAPVRVRAKVDIDRIVGDYLASRNEFDAIALVDRGGHVIAQRSSSGVELARVEPTKSAAAGAGASPGTASTSPDKTVASGTIPDRTIGGDTYKFYEQPVQLSLLTPDGKEEEEWRLCALVRLDRFRAASSAISSTYWLMLIAALAVLCLVMPLLKLHILQPRERFRRNDGVSLAVVTYLIAGLISFALLDACYFGYEFKGQLDRQLRDTAAEMIGSFRSEAKAAMAEIDARANALAVEWRALTPSKLVTRASIKLDASLRPFCEPSWACRQGLLVQAANFQTSSFPYPYFDLVVWTDREGTQRIKRSTGKAVTPFLNIREANLSYYADLQRARRLGPPAAPQTGVAVIQSPNTGSPLTVFWRALPGEPELAAVSMATTPLSLVDPVLPQHMRFAVVDRTGRVLFHSDTNRRLNESFFQECEDDAALKAAVVGGASDTLTVSYLGRRHRLYVTPLEVASTFDSFSDPRWSLMVFQDSLVLETVNLETLTEAAAAFIAFGLLLAAGWGLVCLTWPAHGLKWFWPNDEKASRYHVAALTNGALIVIFLLLIARASPPWVLLGGFFVAIAAASSTFYIVRLSRLPPRAAGAWNGDFLLARATFLFAVAAVPAIACFQVAYDFETGLLVRRDALHLAQSFDARTERVRTFAQNLPLCKTDEDTCARINAFVERRLSESPWDVHLVSFARSTPRGGATAGGDATWLDRIVGIAHLPYNDVAVDTQAALPTASTGAPTATLWNWSRDAEGKIVFAKGDIVLASLTTAMLRPGLIYWLLAIIIAGCLYLIVKLIAPFFLLDLYVPPGLKSLGNRELSGNLLLIGPPGSGKTYALRKTPGSRVFDVRTLAFTEATPDTTATGARLQTLEDALNPLALPDGGVLGIDHLEYRIDDPGFRERVLVFLEKMIYGRHYRVWIASTREPVDQIQDAGALVDLDAWRRMFQPFHKEAVGIAIDSLLPQMENVGALIKERQVSRCVDLEALVLAECSFSPQLLAIAEEVVRDLPAGSAPTREDVLFEIGIAAEPFYRAIWASCSKPERIVLRQLAEEGVVNPRNPGVVAQLMRSGLVRRNPCFCFMNETFRRFVLRELPSETLVEWEHQGVRLPWASVTTTMATVALGIGGVLVLTQQQLIDAWVGYVPALAPAVPTVWKLLTSTASSSKAGTNA